MINNNLVDFAEESFFCDFKAEEIVGVLLNKVRANLEKTITTPAEANALVGNLTAEAADFNKCLTTVLNATHEAEAGRISKQEAIEIAKPCIASLKEACVKLLGSDSDLASDNSDVNEVELRCLREFIVGAKTIAEERRAVLAGEEGAKRPDGKAGTLVDNARGGILEAMNHIDYETMTEATEGFNLSKQASLLQSSPEAKSANALLKKAKAFHKEDPQKALSMVNQAEGMYVRLLAKAEKLAPVKKAEVKTKENGYGVSQSIKTSQKAYANLGIASVVDFFQDRIAACRALKMVWENKANKGSYGDLKKQIKEELKAKRKENKANRKAARAEAKAAKKAAKAAPAPSAESFLYGDDDDSMAMESILQDLDAATESFEEDIFDDSDVDEIAVEANVMTMLIDAGFEDELDYL